jgi:hypothetical protein
MNSYGFFLTEEALIAGRNFSTAFRGLALG